MQVHTRSRTHTLTHTVAKQVLIHTCWLASGLKIALCSHRFCSSHYFTWENCRIQDNRERLLVFPPALLPWQHGKMRKIIIGWGYNRLYQKDCNTHKQQQKGSIWRNYLYILFFLIQHLHNKQAGFFSILKCKQKKIQFYTLDKI